MRNVKILFTTKWGTTLFAYTNDVAFWLEQSGEKKLAERFLEKASGAEKLMNEDRAKMNDWRNELETIKD